MKSSTNDCCLKTSSCLVPVGAMNTVTSKKTVFNESLPSGKDLQMQVCIYDSKMYLIQYYANGNFITMLLNYIIGQYSNLWIWIASYSPDAISPCGFFLDSYEKTISHTDTQLYAWKQMQSPLCTCVWQLKNKNQVIALSTKATTTMKIKYAAATSCSFPIVHPPHCIQQLKSGA